MYLLTAQSAVSRENARRRRVINETEIVNLLNKFGFEKVKLESMSVTQQAQMLSSVECVIAPHGAGLSNLVFCSPGTKVIELFSPNYLHTCFWHLSSQVRMEYYYLPGKGQYLPKTYNEALNGEDILI